MWLRAVSDWSVRPWKRTYLRDWSMAVSTAACSLALWRTFSWLRLTHNRRQCQHSHSRATQSTAIQLHNSIEGPHCNGNNCPQQAGKEAKERLILSPYGSYNLDWSAQVSYVCKILNCMYWRISKLISLWRQGQYFVIVISCLILIIVVPFGVILRRQIC